jgi:hypothetical protein
LVDLGTELGELGKCAEAPIDMASVIDLVTEDLNSLEVDGAGHGEPSA